MQGYINHKRGHAATVSGFLFPILSLHRFFYYVISRFGLLSVEWATSVAFVKLCFFPSPTHIFRFYPCLELMLLRNIHATTGKRKKNMHAS